MKEYWKPIDNSRYLISSKGRIKSFCYSTEKILSPNRSTNGYLSVQLSIDGHIKRYQIHRLVSKYFLPKSKFDEVNHIDGNKENNHISNLEWTNRTNNMLHAYKNKLRIPSPSYGEKHGMSKLKNSDIQKIRKLYSQEGFSYRKIATLYKVEKTTIGRIISGLRWKHI